MKRTVYRNCYANGSKGNIAKEKNLNYLAIRSILIWRVWKIYNLNWCESIEKLGINVLKSFWGKADGD